MISKAKKQKQEDKEWNRSEKTQKQKGRDLNTLFLVYNKKK